MHNHFKNRQQVINARTLGNEQKNRSIVQKIALQMNCKLGGSLWSIKIPFQNVMIIGIDSYHDKKSGSVSAFVASLNDTYTHWYSKAVVQGRNEELVRCEWIAHFLWINFIEMLKLMRFFVWNVTSGARFGCVIPNGFGALQKGQQHASKENHHFPVSWKSSRQSVVSIWTHKNRFHWSRFYPSISDGVGDGQLKAVKDYELAQLKTACAAVSEDYKPPFTFVVVQKRVNVRFYTKKGPNAENPLPGSVLDNTITRRGLYDFYLVPQSVRQGTVTPTHCVVLEDENGYAPDVVQRLTYKLCFLYYNWPGTVRVPACCQYAHKMAFLVGQLKRAPAEQLSDKLFYL